MFLIFQFAHFTFKIDNSKAQWMQTNFTFYGNQYSIQTVTIKLLSLMNDTNPEIQRKLEELYSKLTSE
jgi:hypothetical protein